MINPIWRAFVSFDNESTIGRYKDSGAAPLNLDGYNGIAAMRPCSSADLSCADWELRCPAPTAEWPDFSAIST